MPSLNATKARVNGWLTGSLTALDNYQLPPYWQGLNSHSAIPAHVTAADNDITPDQLDSQPTDQPVSWNDADFIPQPITTWPCSLQVNVYDGPSGVGYTAVATFLHGGDEYRKTINSGPETYREHDWQPVLPASI